MSWDDVNSNGGREKKEKTPYTAFGTGNTVIRVLDNEPYSYWSHWLNKQKTSVACIGKECPICGVIAQMKANNEAPIYTSTKRHAIRVWNYNTNQMEVMIQGKNFFQQLLTLHKEVGDITTYDIKVVRKGEGTDTTYTLLPTAPKAFEISEGIKEVILSDVLSPPTKEEMLMLMEGKTWEEINNASNDAA